MAKKHTTAAERAHMARVAAIGCIACKNMGYEDTPAEIHHITTASGMGRRNSHYHTIPLCFAHHSAQSPLGFHNSPRRWQQEHGQQLALLEQVIKILKVGGGNVGES